MSCLTKKRVLLAICFAVCAASGVQAQIDKWGYWQNGVSEAWWFSPAQFTTQQAGEAIARWKNIEDENHAAPSNEWIGTYFSSSDVHGTNLRMSPRSGFVIAHVDKCQAKVVRDLDENGQEIPFDHEMGERYSKIVAGRKLTTSPF